MGFNYRKGSTIRIINLTPHPITFKYVNSGEEFTVESMAVLNANPVEEAVESGIDHVSFVTTKFVGTEEGWALVNSLRAEYGPEAILVGSIIAAQAYGSYVVAMVPHPDYVRVPPSEKRMRPDKFTVYGL